MIKKIPDFYIRSIRIHKWMEWLVQENLSSQFWNRGTLCRWHCSLSSWGHSRPRCSACRISMPAFFNRRSFKKERSWSPAWIWMYNTGNTFFRCCPYYCCKKAKSLFIRECQKSCISQRRENIWNYKRYPWTGTWLSTFLASNRWAIMGSSTQGKNNYYRF